MVKSAKKCKKNSLGLLEIETAVLECFLEKTPLSPLGVKMIFSHRGTCRNYMSREYLSRLCVSFYVVKSKASTWMIYHC
jgi:hypothetical protein